MLTKKMISKRANPTSYARGVEIYARNEVIDFQVDEEEEIDYITALVKGIVSIVWQYFLSMWIIWRERGQWKKIP